MHRTVKELLILKRLHVFEIDPLKSCKRKIARYRLVLLRWRVLSLCPFQYRY